MRETVILYTTAVCNLNCVYCYIDKNSALVEIDNILDESFKEDYYENFIAEMFPDPNSLKNLETWGGEPFLRMDRIHNTLRRIIPKYPNFSQLFSSTNMAFNEWTDQFFGLMNVLGEFPNRRFNYSLQVSLDGPEQITDNTRGKGTTKKLLKNYKKMVSMLGNNLPSNVNLNIHFKPTLDTNTLLKLDSKEAIIEYYSLFDSLTDDVKKLNFSNVNINPSIPNMACPCLATQNDGKFFANLCKMTREIENQKMFKHYSVITPFAFGKTGTLSLTLKYANYTCGTGYTNIGLLPNNLISTCHNGFVDLVSDYKKLVTANKGKSTIDAKLFLSTHKSRLVYTKDEYSKFESQMMCFNCKDTSARLSTITTQIMLLAHADQILPIYKDMEEAKKAAIFYQSHTAFCIRDNMVTTGSLTTVHNGLFKLLFNGAHQYLERTGDIDWVK